MPECQGHAKHLCQRMAKGAALDEVRKLVKNAQFICAGCGRVAAEPKYLCEPEKL